MSHAVGNIGGNHVPVVLASSGIDPSGERENPADTTRDANPLPGLVPDYLVTGDPDEIQGPSLRDWENSACKHLVET